jgi:8-oxo-dGTP pyrophosphatase MutT (NUDIX family)
MQVANERAAGIVICLNNKNQVLIIRRSDYDGRGGQWTIPGGHIDEDDPSYIAGAKRELAEETNLFVEVDDLEYIGMPKPKKYYYLAHVWSGEVKIDIPNPKTGVIEHDSFKWASINELKGMDNTEIPIYLLEEALEVYKGYKK